MNSTPSKGKRLFFIVYSYLALFCALALWRLVVWIHRQFGENLDFDIMFFHMLAPWDGIYTGFITSALQGSVLVPLILTLAIFLLTYVFCGKKYLPYYWRAASLLLLASLVYAYAMLGMHTYLFAKPTTFYEEHYVDMRRLAYGYPAEAKNLLFIFMESMESTYADEKVFGRNLLPQISRLGEDNQSLRGYVKVYNTHWTFAALVSVLCGLPVQTEAAGYANAPSLSDTLKPAGYRMAALYGGKRHFAWTDTFLAAHSFDHIWAMEDIQAEYGQGLVIKQWGVADVSLYQVARDKLGLLHASGRPFALFINTIDTHVPGYLDSGCPVQYRDLRDVVVCADIMLGGFMRWAREQPWYSNTVIIIVGDHLAMQNNLSDKFLLPHDARRDLLNVMINTPSLPNERRGYAMFDLLPTIVEALGIDLPDHRLGLGSSLFSTKPTLLEQYGEQELSRQLQGRSRLYDLFNR